jgi:hypothetical protein
MIEPQQAGVPIVERVPPDPTASPRTPHTLPKCSGEPFVYLNVQTLVASGGHGAD